MAQKRITGIFTQTINELITLIDQKDREIKEHKKCIIHSCHLSSKNTIYQRFQIDRNAF